MKLSTQVCNQIDTEINQLLETGLYKVVDFSIFEDIGKIKLNQNSLRHYRFILEMYKDYLDDIAKLPLDVRENFLKALKNAEVLDNHRLEKENSFLLGLYLQTQNRTAIDELINHSGGKIYQENVQYIHLLLMDGTSSSDNDNYSFRSDNRKYVGEYVNGERIIQYFPLNYKDIELAIDEVLTYYNDKNNENEETLLIKPLVVNGLIAALQLFDDGNTRLARLFQHIKLWTMTNDIYKVNLPLPALYITRSCYPYRGQSRKLVSDLVTNPSNDSWNAWINFNFNRLEDQINYNGDNLHRLTKLLQK